MHQSSILRTRSIAFATIARRGATRTVSSICYAKTKQFTGDDMEPTARQSKKAKQLPSKVRIVQNTATLTNESNDNMLISSKRKGNKSQTLVATDKQQREQREVPLDDGNSRTTARRGRRNSDDDDNEGAEGNSKISDAEKTKRYRSRRETDTNPNSYNYMTERTMMDHSILTMEEEQQYGIAVQRAVQLQQLIDTYNNNNYQDHNKKVKKTRSSSSTSNRRRAKAMPVVKPVSSYDDDDTDDDDNYDDDDDDELYNLSVYGKRKQLIPEDNMFEQYYVGSTANDYNGDYYNTVNVLKNFDSKSRMTKIQLLQQQQQRNDYTDDTLKDDDVDYGNYYDSIDSAILSVGRTEETEMSLLDYSNDMIDDDPNDNNDDNDDSDSDDIQQLTDDVVRVAFNIPGGKNELRQILQDGAIARDTLIRSNLKLVSSIAKKWSKMSAKVGDMTSSTSQSTSRNSHHLHTLYNGGWDRPSLSEAIQEGTIGLTKAAERFNPQRGLRFSTYATYWITNSIRQCFQKTSTGCIRVPMNYYEIKSKFKSLVKQYYESDHTYNDNNDDDKSNASSPPSMDIIAKEMKISHNRLRTILQLTRPLVSIDAPLLPGLTTRAGKAGGNSLSETDDLLLSDTLIYECDSDNPCYNIELSFLRQCLENAMATELQPQERDILRLRLGLDDGYSRTCKEVSQSIYGGKVSISEIRSTEQRAFKKLRSPRTVSTYKLLSYLDFADVDTETIKMR